MGISLCAVFDQEVPPHGTLGGDNLTLGGGLGRLDKVLAAAGLPMLGDYLSADPAEVADLLGGEVGEGDLPQWFDPAEGLKAVRAAAEHLRSNPKAISRSAAALQELGSLDEELTAAAAQGAKFHFAVLD